MSDFPDFDDSDGLLQFSAESAPTAETSAEVRATDRTAHRPLEPQQLASTGDVASIRGQGQPPGTTATRQDWLAVFATESADEPAPATMASAPLVPAHIVEQSAPRASAAVLWSRSAFMRLVAASVAAFVAGAVSVLLGLHALQSPSTAVVDQKGRVSLVASVVSVGDGPDSDLGALGRSRDLTLGASASQSGGDCSTKIHHRGRDGGSAVVGDRACSVVADRSHRDLWRPRAQNAVDSTSDTRAIT